jgi:hypothetical protein
MSAHFVDISVVAVKSVETHPSMNRVGTAASSCFWFPRHYLNFVP